MPKARRAFYPLCHITPHIIFIIHSAKDTSDFAWIVNAILLCMWNYSKITLLNTHKTKTQNITFNVKLEQGYITTHLKPDTKKIKYIIRCQYPGNFSGDPSSDLYIVPIVCVNHTVLQAVLRAVNHKHQLRESD